MTKLYDYDFSQEKRFGRGMNGFGRSGLFAKYGDVAPVLPESQWKEVSERIKSSGGGCSRLVTRIYNQGREGSCVANASSQAVEIVQARQFGKDRVTHLSAMSLYKRIGRGPSSGAMVSDGIEELVKDGVLPLDDEENKKRFKHYMPNTGWSTPFPEGWQETGKLFKALEWTEITSYEELVSALLFQHPVVVGRSGHSICYCDFYYEDGSPVVKYANSWGNWGDNGYGYDTSRSIQSSSHWAYALRSIVAPTFQDH